MIRDAIQYIVGLREPKKMEVGGSVFVDKEMFHLKTPAFPTLEVNSLTAVVDYLKGLKNEKWAEEDAPIIVHIENEKTVLLKDTADATEGKRDIFLKATAEVKAFRFGEFHPSEAFIIAMQSTFLDTPDKAAILQIVGNLRDEAIQTLSDDGVSQAVTIRTGIAAVGTAKVPNPAELAPFRTFLEVPQPKSKFIFRMRDGGLCGLFEADGGAWKLEAKKNIYDFLKKELEEEIAAGKVVLIA